MRLVCDKCSSTLTRMGSDGKGLRYKCIECNRHITNIRITSAAIVYQVENEKASETREKYIP